MVRHLVIDGETQVLRLETRGEVHRFTLNGAAWEASLAEAEPGVYSVILNGRSFEARVIREKERMVIEVSGVRIPVELRDPRDSRRSGTAAGHEGRQTLMAPMPGKIIRLLVSEGDAVEAGQGLVVIEAMKMQNEMKALKPGQVISLPVATGSTVSAGDILAVVE
ncbi:MAG TPA: biotin/lipoyl-containing protein [Bryobacteraceae bacterium]|nr:biotin/lipoyl-containing protein [Bryobacteraceae bacterium]